MTLISLAVISIVVAAFFAARSSKAEGAAASGTLLVSGSWTGKDADAFKAVLAAFMKQNPGITVTYAPAPNGNVTQTIARIDPVTRPDLAVLSLPRDQQAMVDMARKGQLRSIDFAAPTVSANYAYSWKLLGSVDGKLTGLVFKATNRSAFWYDTKAWASLGIKPPSSWSDFNRVAGTIRANGLAPFAVSGASDVALPNLFQNLYLAFWGNHAYDKLAGGTLKWNDSSVASTLTRFKSAFQRGIAGGLGSLNGKYANAVQGVFGSPMKAYMLPGGSAVMPVRAASHAVRPLSQFGTFAFPRTDGKSPPRVLGDADAVVMVKDSAPARALINYLATPAAAAVWAAEGTDFLSPNRKVAATAYKIPQMAQLAQQLAAANTFRFGIAAMQGAKVTRTMSAQLARYLAGTATRGDVMSRLLLASGEST
jgi:ABC-type glycerol-3-phosphate transport system substrate-binding protein